MNRRYVLVNIMIVLFVNNSYVSNHLRIINVNQECNTIISKCIKCSANFTLCHQCKEGYKLSADQKQCNKPSKKNIIKLLLSIIIPIIVFALVIFIAMLVKIQREKSKSPSAQKLKRSKVHCKNNLSLITKLSKSTNSRKTVDHQYTVTKYTDISTKSKFHPTMMESSVNHFNNAQKISTYQSNFNLITPNATIGPGNFTASVNNINNSNRYGPTIASERNVGHNYYTVHHKRKASKSYADKMPKKKNVFATEIRVVPLVNQKFKNIKHDLVHNNNVANRLSGSRTPTRQKCSKCHSRKVYCTLSCNCNLCLEHFKEIGLSPNNKYVCEKHSTQIYSKEYSSKKILPNLMINSTSVKKIK